MAISAPKMRCESGFMLTQVPIFLKNFSLSFVKEGSCIEYFIEKRFSTETISSALIFSYSPIAKDLHVSRFYPELYRQTDSKYMSAACFYLLIHHCAGSYSMDDACHISLETVPTVSDGFYIRLKDFNFHVYKNRLGNVVELISDIFRLPVDTSMIKERIFRDGDIPFLK
ncbi:hypothetical protein B2D07_07805 [Desulfococcus multivorans]|jgi:hypothetical protein|uniref:Uncharacterized protein n=1 Tax=Desulfococcus multivorans DSM 2059 TaxID=1121405 RepID=S7TZG1_DESML|nr:conserved uncharacterized protein [Desulfococcus multivorans]AQV00686.1 hypothetical protein B2D07_07805 [Desulfococcus multivorans]EPR42571.1 hypothetical protein dsmv_1559 [Desulfococcus multivorans DSM 2059]SKA18443.1 hypothetical protein SAMN02745446_03147 [Desulfococcus multivorans DSM 2059]